MSRPPEPNYATVLVEIPRSDASPRTLPKAGNLNPGASQGFPSRAACPWDSNPGRMAIISGVFTMNQATIPTQTLSLSTVEASAETLEASMATIEVAAMGIAAGVKEYRKTLKAATESAFLGDMDDAAELFEDAASLIGFIRDNYQPIQDVLSTGGRFTIPGHSRINVAKVAVYLESKIPGSRVLVAKDRDSLKRITNI